MSIESQLKERLQTLSEYGYVANSIFIHDALKSDLSEINGIPIQYTPAQDIALDNEHAPIRFGENGCMIFVEHQSGKATVMSYTLEASS
jgi:hypothetical protein